MKSLNERIKEHIVDRIESRFWAPGQRIASESQLAVLFGASRMTVNRAVRELTERGALLRRQGLGTFVAPPMTRAPLFEVQSIREDIEKRGGAHSCSIIRLESVSLSEEETKRLGFTGLSKLTFLEAVHSADGSPLQLERRYVNSDLAPGFLTCDFTHQTASEYLVATVPFSEVEHAVAAVGAERETACLLDLAEGAPCLSLTRRTRLNGRLVTRVELIHPGDRFNLTGRFSAPAPSLLVA